MNVLVHQGALGDWVLTFPLLRALTQLGPTYAVTGWGKAKLAAALIPGVTPLGIENSDWTALHAAVETDTAPRPQSLPATASLVISFVSTGADTWAMNVRWFAPHARIAFVDPLPPAEWKGHVTAWHQHQLHAQRVELPQPPPLQPRIHAGGAVVVHPGSGGVKKCWPADRFEAILDALGQNGIATRPVLGETEIERWPAAQLDRWRDVYSATFVPDLDTIRAILADARGFIGNDAGPTHLAAQMGLRTFALFGPSDAARWAPVGPAVTLLAPAVRQPMQWLSVPDVMKAILPALRG